MPNALLEQIEELKQTALADFSGAADLAALDQLRVKFLGSHGQFTALMKQLGSLSKEEKPAAGKAINTAKAEIENALASRRSDLELKSALPKEPTDFTLPGRRRVLGKLHPLTQVTEDIVRSFRKIGFVVADGPEIEDEYHCFDALNTPADHPARDTQDTFYLASDATYPTSQSVTIAGATSPSPGGEGRGEGNRSVHPDGNRKSFLLRTHTSSVQIRVM